MSIGAIVGQGAFRYAVDRNWAKLPPGRQLGTTHAITEDAAGRIYVHHLAHEGVFIFSPTGDLEGVWGADFCRGAHGMRLNMEDGAEYLYFAANRTELVVKTTLDGREVLRLPPPPRPDIYGEDRPYRPTEIAVSASGDIYVADGYGQYWIHRFAANGEYRGSFGQGEQDGLTLRNPHGIFIDSRSGEERLAIADRGNSRIVYCDLDGRPLREVSAHLRQPCTGHVWRDVLFVPDLHSRITVLDRNDTPVAQLGDWDGRWNQPGWPNLTPVAEYFSSPHDLHVDAAGNIYLVEWMSDGTGCLLKLELLER